jgi:hypothetical protein
VGGRASATAPGVSGDGSGCVLLLPSVQLAAVAAGVGAWWVLSAARRRAPLGALALAGVVTWQLVATWPVVDASGPSEARRWGEAALAAQPAGAVLRLTDEHQTFVLWYLQHVEGRRRDVALVNEHLLAFDWYRAQLRRLYPSAGL